MRMRLLTAFVVVVLDQATKYLADKWIGQLDTVRVLPFLQLVNVKNKGAAFGLFKTFGNSFFIAVSAVAIVVIVVMILKDSEHRFSFSLLLGGAVGNLIDRLALGYVRDFVDVFAGRYHWPAFNAADSALSIGLVLILAGEVFDRKKKAGAS